MTEQSPCRTRTEKAVAWTVGHAGELAAVTVPGMAGLVTTGWLEVAAAAIAAVWAAHEIRLRRSTRDTRAALATTTQTSRQIAASSNPASAPDGAEATGRKEAKA